MEIIVDSKNENRKVILQKGIKYYFVYHRSDQRESFYNLNVVCFSIDDFYYLSRSAMVKDERHIDKFDRVFGHVFKGLEPVEGEEEVELPEEWLRKMSEKFLTKEEMDEIEANEFNLNISRYVSTAKPESGELLATHSSCLR